MPDLDLRSATITATVGSQSGEPSNLIDQNATNQWSGLNYITTLTLSNLAPTSIIGYGITSAISFYNESAPGSWTLEGSTDNGTTWETIDTRTGQNSTWPKYTRKDYQLAAPTKAFNRFRFRDMKAGTYIWIGELHLVTDGAAPPPTATFSGWGVPL